MPTHRLPMERRNSRGASRLNNAPICGKLWPPDTMSRATIHTEWRGASFSARKAPCVTRFPRTAPRSPFPPRKDLINQWIVVQHFTLDRDWTWSGLAQSGAGAGRSVSAGFKLAGHLLDLGHDEFGWIQGSKAHHDIHNHIFDAGLGIVFWIAPGKYVTGFGLVGSLKRTWLQH